MNKTMARTLVTLFSIITVQGFGINADAQGAADTLSNKQTDSLIIKYSAAVNQKYFDKSKSVEIEKVLMKKLRSGEYYKHPARQLTNKLSLLLREITNDMHFYIGLQEPVTENSATSTGSSEKENKNAGFSEVKLLEHNIGYLKWNDFIADDISFKKIIAAFTFLEGCDYLIFDISHCPGGDGRAGSFVNRHLYEDDDYQDVLIKKCTGEKEWRQSEVPYNYTNGPRFFDVPIFIITSKQTASSAEYFALIAQEMKRATILGDTTAGAGNPVIAVFFDQFFAHIPICQIETESGKSISGKGVAPDVRLTSGNWVDETVKYILKKSNLN